MKIYKCNVCGDEYHLTDEQIKHNLKHYNKKLPITYCFEDDGGKLKEIKKE